MAILTGRTALATIQTGDFLHVVDVSDTTDNAAGSSFKMTIDNLLKGIATLGSDGSGNLLIPGNTDLEGYAAIGDGSALSTNTTLAVHRDFTGSGSTVARGIYLSGTMTGGVSDFILGAQIAPAFVEASSGTHSNISSLYLNAPTVTGGGGAAVTSSSTLYIVGAPSGGTAPTHGPYSLFVDAGDSRFDGDVILNGGVLSSDISIDSAAVADQVSFGGYEIGAGNRVMAFSQETVVAADTDETKFSNKVQVRINGVTYFIMLTTT